MRIGIVSERILALFKPVWVCVCVDFVCNVWLPAIFSEFFNYFQFWLNTKANFPSWSCPYSVNFILYICIFLDNLIIWNYHFQSKFPPIKVLLASSSLWDKKAVSQRIRRRGCEWGVWNGQLVSQTQKQSKICPLSLSASWVGKRFQRWARQDSHKIDEHRPLRTTKKGLLGSPFMVVLIVSSVTKGKNFYYKR